LEGELNLSRYKPKATKKNGKLTCICRVNPPSHLKTPRAYYLYLCDCKNTPDPKVVTDENDWPQNLTSTEIKSLLDADLGYCLASGADVLAPSGKQTSCGCLNHQTPPNAKDWVGQRFGRLTVTGRGKPVKRRGKSHSRSTVVCRCDCGAISEFLVDDLKSGKRQSCGCARIEGLRERTTTHGMSQSPEYNTWAGMIQRCTNPKDPEFKNYGARGVKVCDSWREDFNAFYSDMGPKPEGTSLDRADNDGNYEPENCHWVNNITQASNKRSNKRYTLGKLDFTASEWSRLTGVPAKEIIRRIDKIGWTIHRALTEPVAPRKPRSDAKSIWKNLKQRCDNPNHISYKYYGGKGVSYSEEFKTYEGFIAVMGERPSPQHSIDRIDPDGNYEPGNVRWILSARQARNTSRNAVLVLQGHLGTVYELSKHLHESVTPYLALSRINKGWTVEEAFKTPRKACRYLPGKRHPYQDREWTVAELAEHSGLKKALIATRLRQGWTVEQAITIPLNQTREEFEKRRLESSEVT